MIDWLLREYKTKNLYARQLLKVGNFPVHKLLLYRRLLQQGNSEMPNWNHGPWIAVTTAYGTLGNW